jgi:hypothetical protein
MIKTPVMPVYIFTEIIRNEEKNMSIFLTFLT